MFSIRRLACIAVLLVSIGLTSSCGAPEAPIDSREQSLSAAVEKWRELVEKHFKYQHVTWALNIIACESGGNPSAYNASSGASGLFQHLKKYWADRANKAGFPGASAFDAEANIAASAWLLYAPGGGPQHWSCKHSPFEDFNYQPQFYKDGNPVGPPPPPPPPCGIVPASGGVIDEAGSCFALHGPSQYWRTVSGSGHNGALRWTNATQASAPSNWARWTINVASAGSYKLWYYAVPTYAKFDKVRYVLRHGGQDKTIIVDQSQGGSGWRVIGTYTFAAGGGQHLSVHDDTPSAVASDQHIIADAIKLTPATTTPPPPPPKDSGVPTRDAGAPSKPDAGAPTGPEPDSGQPIKPAADSGAELAPDSGSPYPGVDSGLYLPPNNTGGNQLRASLSGGCALAPGDPIAGNGRLTMLGLLLLLGLVRAWSRRR
jgi:hypothetical protein